MKLRLVLAVLLLPSLSAAQGIDSYEIQFFQGGVLPVSTYAFTVADVVCGQPFVAPGLLEVNPTEIRWADPDAAGLDCLHDTTTASPSPIFALPIGTTEAELVAINAAGPGPGSARSNPFSRLDPPAAQTGLRLRAP